MAETEDSADALNKDPVESALFWLEESFGDLSEHIDAIRSGVGELDLVVGRKGAEKLKEWHQSMNAWFPPLEERIKVLFDEFIAAKKEYPRRDRSGG